MSDINTQQASQRRTILIGISAVVLIILVIIGTVGFKQPDTVEEYTERSKETRKTMSDLSRQPVAEENAYEALNDQLQTMSGQIQKLNERLDAKDAEATDLQAQLDASESRNRELMAGADEMVGALMQQIDSLEQPGATIVADQETRTNRVSPGNVRGPGPTESSGQPLPSAADPFAPRGAVQPTEATPGEVSQVGRTPFRAFQSVSFIEGNGDAEGELDGNKSSAELVSTENYVPPNAYLPAAVLVGVDATVGRKGGNDPKPVLFRVTGPARSAMEDGHIFKTDVIGCLINGAAYGELSSEKVYVKIAKMTCPAKDGTDRVAESDVEGFVAYAGKSGVRGRVISREGDFTEKAFIAGTLQGLGSSLSRAGGQSNPLGGFSGTTEIPDGEEIAVSSIGGGIEGAASRLADYYIERAEQYQPVIEMPTGIQVEIVLLNGVTVR